MQLPGSLSLSPYCSSSTRPFHPLRRTIRGTLSFAFLHNPPGQQSNKTAFYQRQRSNTLYHIIYWGKSPFFFPPLPGAFPFPAEVITLGSYTLHTDGHNGSLPKSPLEEEQLSFQ